MTPARVTRSLHPLLPWGTLLAAGGLLASCGGRDTSSRTMSVSEKTQTGTRAIAAAGAVSVRLNITGLLLVVPPKTSGAVTNVLVPKRASHSALFGFGIDPANPPAANFCANPPVAPPGATAKGMCYVNLADWDLGALGAPPPSTNPVALEKFGLINVTQGSGGGKKVVLNDIRHLLTSLVALNTGSPTDDCSLALWTYRPNGKPAETLFISNVLHWDMSLADTTHFVFTRKAAPHDTVLVPIVAKTGQRTEVVLANVPEHDVPDLPPAQGGSTASNTMKPGDEAKDFDVFYDLLGVPAATPGIDPRRPLPRLEVSASSVACPVSISRLKSYATDLRIPNVALRRGAREHGGTGPGRNATPTDTSAVGVKTYACMPATADIGP